MDKRSTVGNIQSGFIWFPYTSDMRGGNTGLKIEIGGAFPGGVRKVLALIQICVSNGAMEHRGEQARTLQK